MISLNDIKKIHCVGIGGIGVSAIAKFFNARGVSVSGSDAMTFDWQKDLEERGIKVYIGHRESNVPKDVDLIVYSPAVPKDNPELLDHVEKLSYTEALGKIMGESFGVAVSGTNGKTTTTAMLGKILEGAGVDPTVIVGGKVSGWDGNLRVGKGDIFLAEACEYKRGMLNTNPKIIVLTNLEADHLDYYKDIEDIKSAFKDYVSKLPEGGILVYNKDDVNLCEVADSVNCRKISYGIKDGADLEAKNIKQGEGHQQFEVFWKEKGHSNSLGIFKIQVPGIFNIYNTLGALGGALALGDDGGHSKEALKNSLENFKGTWRRFENVGEVDGKLIISDYAHHPTAVKATIKGAKNFYPSNRLLPGRSILAVFQPHQKDRTIKLFDDFVKAFDDADEVILSEIYEVKGRNEVEKDISSKDIILSVRKRNPDFPISYAKNLEETENIIKERMGEHDVILIMGAGDIYKVADSLVKS